MDESLKARLIGAAVLVVLAVLLIPELLTGRKTDAPPIADPGQARATRTYTIELGTGRGSTETAPPARQGVPAADPEVPPGDLPVPAPGPLADAATRKLDGAGDPGASADPSPAPRAASGPPGPVANQAEGRAANAGSPAPAKPTPGQASGTATGQGGGWLVQVGAFGSLKSAEKLAADLNGAGYKVRISPLNRSGKTLHRVQVGPEPTREDAERLAEKLKARRLPATLLENE